MDNQPKTYQELKNSVLKDPSSSFWLQKTLNFLETRDPVDVLADVRHLLYLCEKRVKEVQEQNDAQ